MRRRSPEEHRRHLHHREKIEFLLCVDQQKVCMNLLHEATFMKLVSSLYDLPYNGLEDSVSGETHCVKLFFGRIVPSLRCL
jgi:hypothetical protein